VQIFGLLTATSSSQCPQSIGRELSKSVSKTRNFYATGERERERQTERERERERERESRVSAPAHSLQ